jgi:hypothetical protein
MSDAEIWGPCGHNWLDFACYAAGVLDDEIEARTVEVQAVACAACSDELGDHLELAGLIYEAVVLFAGSRGVCQTYSAGSTRSVAWHIESAASAYPWCRARRGRDRWGRSEL